MQVEFLIQLKTGWILHTWWKFQEAHAVFQFCRPSFFFFFKHCLARIFKEVFEDKIGIIHILSAGHVAQFGEINL